MIDILLKNPLDGEVIPLHAWELGLSSRRERVAFSDKVKEALIYSERESRQFAYFNSNTSCWSVFYSQYTAPKDSLLDNLENMTNLKLIKEIKEKSFEYSVFGYGFHISSGDPKIALVIEDADKISKIDDIRYNESLKYFGKPKELKIKEFT